MAVAVLTAPVDLAREIGSPCWVAFYEAGHVVFTDSVRVIGERVLPMVRGERALAAVTAAGKILLAYADPAELERVARAGCPPLTSKTRTTYTEIMDDIRLTRQQAWGIAEGEFDDNAAGMAVAVLTAPGDAVGALSVTAPKGPIPTHWRDRFLATAPVFAARASAQLGFVDPGSTLIS
jgi:DNA-binding IclR family transcriptional regulator